MAQIPTVFSQVFQPLHPQVFKRAVERYDGNKGIRTFSCWDQFLSMSFGQLTYRTSLRDIEACLRARSSLLFRMGIGGTVSRSTLADANETRDWRIYESVASSLIVKARRIYSAEELPIDFEDSVYALDATTIDLCMNLFPWAKFKSTKSAVKLHTLLDLRGNIPSFIDITAGRVHDVNVLDVMDFEPGAMYIMDRGYLDFERLYSISCSGAFFVIRAKKNFRFVRHRSQPTGAGVGICSDQIGRTGGRFESYPGALRRIRFHDSELSRYFVFLTNNLVLPAPVIAQIYKMRWQVELFFKWIKQHLRIKAFYGTSSNAVKTQVWIAVCTYLLVAILKKELSLKQSLHRILQVLSVSCFEQVPLAELLKVQDHSSQDNPSCNQLAFNGF